MTINFQTVAVTKQDKVLLYDHDVPSSQSTTDCTSPVYFSLRYEI